MKYFVNGINGSKNDGLIRLPLQFSLILIALFWIINFFLFYSKMGFSPETIASYYLGNESLYQPSRSITSMLEVTHGHLAMFALLLLVVTHLVIFADFSRKIKLFIISGTYISAILSEGSSWLIRIYSPSFSWVKLISFFTLQGFIILSLAGLVYYWIGYLSSYC